MTTTTKERPILMTTPMVRAILEGRKTQTRRAIKPQPGHEQTVVADATQFSIVDTTGDHACSLHCPYGRQGDRLWVRESWCHKIDDGRFVYNKDGNLDPSCCWYRADGVEVVKVDGDGFTEYCKDGSVKSPWVPSIHMPRWASRIQLEITEVRVERLQGISEEDAESEGCDGWCQFGVCNGRGFISQNHTAVEPELCRCANFGLVERYKALWESINGVGSWDANPWVWVVCFKVLKGLKDE